MPAPVGRLENNSTESVLLLLFPPRGSQVNSGTIKLAKSITEMMGHENKLNKNRVKDGLIG